MQRGGGRGGFRGGRGGDRGRGGGRGFGGGRGGGRGGWVDYGPPDTVVEAGVFEHPCEGEAVCKLSNDKVRPLEACLQGYSQELGGWEPEWTQLKWKGQSFAEPHAGVKGLD